MDFELMNQRLITLRKQSGKTQQEIADYLGICNSTISSYESGRTAWGLEEVCRLADLYHVSMDYLVGRIEHNFLDVQSELSLVYRENELLSAERNMLKGQLELLKQVVNTVVV